MTVVDQIVHLFATKGRELYFGEAVTEAEHALQSARLAEAAGVGREVVAAALLHDIGHLLHGLPEDIAGRGIDGRHEEAGSAWLRRHFGPAVSEPVRLHVAAKRYLCAVERGYLGTLSAGSQRSLKLQGGPFTPDEVRRFEEEQFWESAVAVRRWDDLAKVPGLEVPGLDHYRACLESVRLKGEGE
jgi:phosphonate degradation associated HDIG domain protein